MRKTTPIGIVLLSVLTLSQTVRTAKPSNLGPDAQRLLGAWRVLSVTDTRPDGTEVADLYLGAHPVGFAIYEAPEISCFPARAIDEEVFWPLLHVLGSPPNVG